MKEIPQGRQYIEEQIKSFHTKLGNGEIELSQYIAFIELCTKALKVIEALEAQLQGRTFDFEETREAFLKYRQEQEKKGEQ